MSIKKAVEFVLYEFREGKLDLIQARQGVFRIFEDERIPLSQWNKEFKKPRMRTIENWIHEGKNPDCYEKFCNRWQVYPHKVPGAIRISPPEPDARPAVGGRGRDGSNA